MGTSLVLVEEAAREALKGALGPLRHLLGLGGGREATVHVRPRLARVAADHGANVLAGPAPARIRVALLPRVHKGRESSRHVVVVDGEAASEPPELQVSDKQCK